MQPSQALVPLFVRVTGLSDDKLQLALSRAHLQLVHLVGL
jgi:hypothetical protein